MHFPCPFDPFLEQLLTRRYSSDFTPDFSVRDLTNDHRSDDLTQASLSTLQMTLFAIQKLRAQTCKRINDAIERWRYGKYGKCLNCRQKIKSPRLSVVPEAEFCLKCH